MRNRVPSLNGDINVTPFLDVLLVLIITFMAAMTARMTMDAQLAVPCSTTPCGADQRAIVLEVMADGGYRLNGTLVTAGSLTSTLHLVYDQRPEKALQVAGHRGARYQAVLTAMDVARSAGVKVISLPPSDTYDANAGRK
jgi:biopolymer transport protein ExbD